LAASLRGQPAGQFRSVGITQINRLMVRPLSWPAAPGEVDAISSRATQELGHRPGPISPASGRWSRSKKMGHSARNDLLQFGLPRLFCGRSRIWANAGRCHSCQPTHGTIALRTGSGEGRLAGGVQGLIQLPCEFDVAPLKTSAVSPLRPLHGLGGRDQIDSATKGASISRFTSTFSTGSAAAQPLCNCWGWKVCAGRTGNCSPAASPLDHAHLLAAITFNLLRTAQAPSHGG